MIIIMMKIIVISMIVVKIMTIIVYSMIKSTVISNKDNVNNMKQMKNKSTSTHRDSEFSACP